MKLGQILPFTIVQTVLTLSTEHGIWSTSIIDSWISRGYHPRIDSIIEFGYETLQDHVIASVITYLDDSFNEYKQEMRTIASFTDDYTPLLKLEDLNEANLHRRNTILHLYCRAPETYIIPIQWLVRFGADPDQANQWGITPRDLLKDKEMEYILEVP